MTVTNTATAPVLIAGQWQVSNSDASFQALNPNTRAALPARYPVSTWQDCSRALDAAQHAFRELRSTEPPQISAFLEDYASRIENRADEICQMATTETALPYEPRLKDIELPRTVNQLRLAAAACSDQSWRMATIDTATNIRSILAPAGPVAVFGPNNFPLAFGSASGGDFAAAIAAGNPVIAKANSSHPGTTQLLAEEAQMAAEATSMPAGTVQLIYRLSHDDGLRLVGDPRLGACGYTGSREAGLKLKAAADAVGKPIFLELSSVNPVVILRGALEERSEALVNDYVASGLMGAGQFCTNPGLVLLTASPQADNFIQEVAQRFNEAPPGTLLSDRVETSLAESIQQLRDAGAAQLTSGTPDENRFCQPNTALRISATQFLLATDTFQQEAFGNATLFVVAEDIEQCVSVINALEGNLTGCIYSAEDGRDDVSYEIVASALRPKVGRLLNDKMPTGVAVSPAMNHGGPFPATGNPLFTAVGIPAALTRFSALHCYDNVRPHRLPELLQDKNPNGTTWRLIDKQWTQGDA